MYMPKDSLKRFTFCDVCTFRLYAPEILIVLCARIP